MDIVKAAKYHDRQGFDTFNFNTQSWTPNAFYGQLKISDSFVSIWNRPTRKRMLTCAPDQAPASSLIRVASSGEIFMVGTLQYDSNTNVAYRVIGGLHKAAGPAVLKRKAPTGPANNPGWAVESTILNGYADAELRSVNENQDTEIENFGHYFLFMPKDTPAQLHDTITITDIQTNRIKTYYILELYVDSGYLCGRATAEPDERTNFVYQVIGPAVYNPATQTNTPVVTSYNVTGKVTMVGQEDLAQNEILSKTIKVMILESFIGPLPKINDKIVWNGNTYTVSWIERNANLTEWVLRAKI